MKVVNRVVAVLVALSLLVLSLLVLVEIVWVFGLGGSTELLLPYPAAVEYLGGLTWDSRSTRAILIGLSLVGVLLLVAELRRRKPGLLMLADTRESVTAGVDRRSLQRAAAAAVTSVDGIDKGRVQVSRRRVSVAAESGLRDGGGLQAQAAARMSSWLDELNLADPPALSVRVEQRRSR